jgi:uncharacterized protein YlxP (DUF503 family)
MIVGACLITLRLPENHSLKEKRRVVKSVIERLKNRYGVAAAEVGSNDLWQIAEIGVSCVSGSSAHVSDILANVVSFVENTRLDAEVIDAHSELLSVE